jgi:hypothetical protein
MFGSVIVPPRRNKTWGIRRMAYGLIQISDPILMNPFLSLIGIVIAKIDGVGDVKVKK